jgi:hypothetical protein
MGAPYEGRAQEITSCNRVYLVESYQVVMQTSSLHMIHACKAEVNGRMLATIIQILGKWFG